MTARREVEVRVHIPTAKDGPDVLALLANHQLSLLARSCCADREGLLLLLITSQPEEAQQVLEAADYVCQMHPIILLGSTLDRPGAAARLLAELGKQGANIRYPNLASSPPDTTNAERALEMVNRGHLNHHEREHV